MNDTVDTPTLSLLIQRKTKPFAKRICDFSDMQKEVDPIEVVTEHGVEQIFIPAIARTSYWAILKFMYPNHDRYITPEELANGVDKIMSEEDPVKWERFKNRHRIKTVVKIGDEKIPMVREQPARDWKARLCSNARNLCRIRDYGKRLISIGHVMRYESDSMGNGRFILYMKLTSENIALRKRGRKKKFPLQTLTPATAA